MKDGKMKTIYCATCGVPFAITKQHHKMAKTDSTNRVYCPNGHYNYWPSKDEIEESPPVEEEETIVRSKFNWWVTAAVCAVSSYGFFLWGESRATDLFEKNLERHMNRFHTSPQFEAPNSVPYPESDPGGRYHYSFYSNHQS